MLLIGLAAALTSSATFAADVPSGEQIYRKQCASCHGASGEGNPEEYDKPLTGDRSVAQLQRLIARTMPEDAPGTCVGDDAARVAAYIHESFYSPTAQARNKPARVELARLTVRQYRNVATDLVGTFRSPVPKNDKRGLQAQFFRTKELRGDQRTFQRVDPEVHFDFGKGRPDAEPPLPKKKDEAKPKPPAVEVPKVHDKDKEPEKDKAPKTEEEKAKEAKEKELERQKKRELARKEREKQQELAKKKEEERHRTKEFSARWQGSVFAPETGDYEFIVRTENATRLWVNDPKRPLIDAGVKSGNDTEYRETIRLLGGRSYDLRLEWERGWQEKAGVVSLEWKPPGGVVGVIPNRFLSPVRMPELFVLKAPFPPDDRSIGYERGSSISAEWEQATTEGAIEVASYVATRLRDLTGVMPSEKGREARLREFSWKFAERAFRRPLTDQEIARYIDRQFARSPDPETAVKRVVLLVLKSPKFLYREVGGDDPYDVASRVAFSLWDSLPDAELLDAAASGRLSTREQVAAQAERMVGDARTRSKLRDFVLHWLKVEPAPDLAKDPKAIPGFDPVMAADLRTSLDLFIEDVIWGESSDFRQLLQADTTYLNGRLAKFYGADLPPDAPFRKVVLDPGQRAGVLSHPYLMATFAYSATSSPIHRGVFLARNVLGRSLRPPPEAVAPLPPDLHAGMSTRERISLQTRPAACQTCHAMINPLGFALEKFDAVGRFRAEESGKPVDSQGSYQVRSGETVTFDGARELAAFLVKTQETQDAFVEDLFHNVVKQPVLAYGSQTVPDLRQSFLSHEFNVRKLLVDIVSTTALTGRDSRPKTLTTAVR